MIDHGAMQLAWYNLAHYMPPAFAWVGLSHLKKMLNCPFIRGDGCDYRKALSAGPGGSKHPKVVDAIVMRQSEDDKSRPGSGFSVLVWYRPPGVLFGHLDEQTTWMLAEMKTLTPSLFSASQIFFQCGRLAGPTCHGCIFTMRALCHFCFFH